jgi:Phosphotransferase enzyme family
MDEMLTDNPGFTHSILGTDDPGEITRRLNVFCETCLGSAMAEVLFCELSVGASFGLRLGDGRRVFLKAYPPDRPRQFLRAVRRVQGYLFERGFPAPRPLAGPAHFGPGLATVDEFVDEGEHADAHDPSIRRKMAQTLARLIDLAGELPDVRGLDKGWRWPKKRKLWPEPHNALFDFEATAKGAECIDDVAEEAKRIVDDFDGEIVVGHADWSVDQMRFKGDEVSVVYDWDSLRLEMEIVVVGHGASHFSATWHPGVPNPPSPEETWLFVEDYEGSRGKPFSEQERKAIAAAAIYGIAYTARCEHALDQEGKDLPGSFREALRTHAEAYFRSGSLGKE